MTHTCHTHGEPRYDGLTRDSFSRGASPLQESGLGRDADPHMAGVSVRTSHYYRVALQRCVLRESRLPREEGHRRCERYDESGDVAVHVLPPADVGLEMARAEAARPTDASMTNSRFEKVWPDVEIRLHRLLRSKHVPRDRGEDFVQEAALRVLRGRVRYDDADDLYRWASVVVRRLAIDAWRKDQRLTDDAVLGSRVSHVDVEAEVEGRLALRAVLEKWPSLSYRARRSIALVVEDRPLRAAEALAVNSARYRARRALRAAANGLLGWTTVAHFRRRS